MVAVMVLYEEHFVSKGSHLEVNTSYHFQIIFMKVLNNEKIKPIYDQIYPQLGNNVL